MKNHSAKYNCDSQLKSRSSLSLKLYFYIACFTFLSFRLLTSLTGIACANSAPDGRKVLQGSVLTSRDPNNIHGIELLKAEISIVKDPNDTKSRDQLRQIIEQIRSVGFEPQKQAPAPVIVPEKAPAIEPNKTVPDVPVQKEEAKSLAKPGLSDKPITDETLEMLMTLAQNPEKLYNPLELGEILFISGNVKEAEMFYSEALRRKDPNDAGASLDRAWILFQKGNCLRNDNMSAAAKMYQQLLTEYPNSPWAGLATARSNLIAWYLKDKPVKLIAEVKHAPSEQDNIR
ncbi:MAG: tetratricopeptide repeat protein [Planctomycetota bacterium]